MQNLGSGCQKTRGYIKKIARFSEKSLQIGYFRQLFGNSEQVNTGAMV